MGVPGSNGQTVAAGTRTIRGMRLRTRLILALLLLSALPLAAVVLFSYVGAQRAVRETVQAEADQLTRDMETHLASVRADIRLGMEELGSPLFLHYLQSDDTSGTAGAGTGAIPPPESFDGPKAPPLPELGQVADLLQTIEIQGNWEDELNRQLDAEMEQLSETAETERVFDDAARAWVLKAPLIRKLALGGSRIGLEVARPFMPEPIQMDDQALDGMAADLEELFDEAVKAATIDSEDPDVQAEREAEVEARLEVIGKRFAARFGVDLETDAEEDSSPSPDAQRDAEAAASAHEVEVQLARRRAEQLARIDRLRERATSAQPPEPRPFPAGESPPEPVRPEPVVRPEPAVRPETAAPRLLLDLDTTVRQGDRVLGRLRPVLDPEAVLQRVMGPLDLRRGEVPFLADREGQLFVLDEAHRAVLEELDVESMVPRDDGTVLADGPGDGAGESEGDAAFGGGREVRDDWVVVLSKRQPSGLQFGIASPVGESLAGVRQAAARNLAGGVGLLALAMLGILPLARRMTGDLEHLTEGVERIAAGDLETAVEVRSRDEIAQLAGAFNRMASDLKTNQGKLVDQAIKERSLAEELARKNDELEAARAFQLSMLPAVLPDHPRYEVAVAMRTATEVGGDYYDFHLGPSSPGSAQASGSLIVAVGDATGHGVTAGRMVTVVKSLFSAAADPDPAVFLGEANRTVKRMNLGRMAMALVMARFEGNEMTLASAGMPPALVLRGEGKVEEVTLAGMPLGGIDRHYRERTVGLGVGDLVVFQSDGLPEQTDSEGDPLGYPAIREHLSAQADRTPQVVIDSLLELLDLWVDGAPPADDVTFVAIRRRA